MPRTIEGSHVVDDARFGIVVSRFNELVTERLLEGALDALKRHGADLDDVTVVRCPGAVEIPLVATKLAETGSYDAVICLGAVIRGATPHFDLVCNAVTSGTTRTTLETGVPVVFGVITTDTVEQALERAGTKSGNKGSDAAVAAIEMVNVLRAIGSSG